MTQQQYWLKAERVKSILRKQLWQVSLFCGVEVLAYCWMDNHIHLLVRVPKKVECSDQILLERCRGLYGSNSFKMERIKSILGLGGAEAAALRQQLFARMYDLSQFVKEWKQRFAIWYNRSHDNFGTLWSERFKSLWVQDHAHVLRSVSAYIHLNPVRAGMVKRPCEFKHSLYGECIQSSSESPENAQNAFLALMGNTNDLDLAFKQYLGYLKNWDSTFGDDDSSFSRSKPGEFSSSILRGKGSLVGLPAFLETNAS